MTPVKSRSRAASLDFGFHEYTRLLSPTDSVKDRLAGYIHWKSRANFEQAVLLCRRQADRVDLNAVREWCAGEGGVTEFEELVASLEEGFTEEEP